MFLGPSVRARRDRQNLVKNKLQLDDVPSGDGDIQVRDLEAIVESSLPSHDDASVNSSTSMDRKRKRSEVSAVVNNEVHHLQNTGDGHSLLPVVDETNDHSVELPAATVSNFEHPSCLQTDVHNASVSKDSCVTIAREDSKKCQLPSTAMSSEPERKKSRTQAAERKPTDSSRLASSKNLPRGKAASPQLSTEGTASGSSSLGVDQQSTGNCVTLESIVDANMHQTVRPDVVLQPSVVKQKEIRVRFEGNPIALVSIADYH